jgi:lactoylglutathione lyase
MTVVGSVHTGFHVADMERSIAFYVDQLGLELRARRVVDAPYVQTLVGYPGAELHQAFIDILEADGVEFLSPPVVPTVGPNTGRPAVYLKDPDGIRIELLEAFAPTV